MECAHFSLKNRAIGKLADLAGHKALYPLMHKGLSWINFGGAVGGTVNDWKMKKE